MPLGTKAGLGPGHIVLRWTLLTPKKGHSPPIFGLCLFVQTVPISATAEHLYRVVQCFYHAIIPLEDTRRYS